MEFKKYQHIERFGTDEVDGIEYGNCYVFYKIDGTNSSVWLDENGNIACGFRTRTLSLENDNDGFMDHVINNDNIKNYLQKHPNHRLYGEWLVKHSLSTYRTDAWRQFYVFDVCLDKEIDIEFNKSGQDVEYIPYEIYQPLLEKFNINYVPPVAIIKNGKYDDFIKLLDKTGQFLIEDGKGKGEGIVIKNYSFYNKFGRQTWAKIVCNEFKEVHHKAMGAPELNGALIDEERIVNEFVTDSFVEKEYQKLLYNGNMWSSKRIPELLNKIYYTLISEEMWNIIKKFKNPKINFKTLNALVTDRIKQVKKDLF
jgi:hypothetical protein